MRGTAQPTIPASDGYVLRPWRPSDVPALRAAFSDPQIQYWHARHFESEEEALEWIARGEDSWAAETDAEWAIAEPDGEAIGQVGLRQISLTFGVGMIAYWVRPEARRRGVATLAVRALSEWAFNDLGLHRITIEHSTGNEASCRVATGAGYPPEGLLREGVLHEDGWHDMHLHARLATDP